MPFTSSPIAPVKSALLLAVVAALAGSTSAEAMEKGDRCTLKTSLKIIKRGPAGTVEAFVERGVDIEVVSVSDGGQTLIRAGEMKGLVATPDLDGACLGTLRSCVLDSDVMMYEQNRSDSRSWRVKPGAEVSVIKKGKTWAAVRVGDLQGFVKSDEMKGACVENDEDEDEDGVTEAVERGEGPGVLALPLHLDGAVPVGDADALLDDLFARLVFYRPDAGRLAADGPRDQPWKQQVERSSKRAKAAETAFVMVGRLAIEPKQAGAAGKDEPAKYLLQLALVEAKTGKVVKGIRAHPTMRPGDTWAERALAALLPTIPSAPGSKLPSTTPKAAN